MTGVAFDALSDQPLGDVTVRVDGLGEKTTSADGTFHFDAANPEQVRPVTLSSAVTVNRSTHIRAPGPTATLSLMPRTLDLRAFDEMFRSNGALHRWTGAPPVVVQARVLQFTGLADSEYVATAATLSDDDVSALWTDLTWGLPQLSGNRLTAFASQQRESAAEGERVRVSRTGVIVVARYRGLTSSAGYWGYTRWSWNGAGELQAAIVMLDADFESSGSPYRRSLRVHELGHAMGCTHVTVRESVMNSVARYEPNAFDRDAAKLAFQRPPLNRTPDIDPDPYTLNRLRAGGVVWMGMQ